MVPPSSHLLPESPAVPAAIAEAIERDYDRSPIGRISQPLEHYLLEQHGIDVATTYAGFPVRNPWGKASGQLSMTAHQVAEDIAAGLGFVVLKTVIAEDESGSQSMQAWAIRESKMVVEPIIGRSGEPGWTVSWKGRGWWLSFADYLTLVREARAAAAASGTLIVPSCKFHLPARDDEAPRRGEYDFTIGRLLEAWRRPDDPADLAMPIEKDFSPTLAGSDRASAQRRILDWLRTVPGLMFDAASRAAGQGRPPAIRVGMKLFNALFDDDFQLEMLRAIHEGPGPHADFFVYGNRLFDPNREFEGHRGIAYGGPDLSDRNLRVMARFGEVLAAGQIAGPPLEWSATGDIASGKMALEYALRGARTFQLHTFFQLPADRYRMAGGTRCEKALHELYFHPQTGLIVWLHHLAQQLGLPRDPLRFRDVVGSGPRLR